MPSRANASENGPTIHRSIRAAPPFNSPQVAKFATLISAAPNAADNPAGIVSPLSIRAISWANTASISSSFNNRKKPLVMATIPSSRFLATANAFGTRSGIR